MARTGCAEAVAGAVPALTEQRTVPEVEEERLVRFGLEEADRLRYHEMR